MQVQSDEYWGAQPDPVAQFSAPVCGHMNADHSESTVAMVKQQVGVDVDKATMLSIDRLGFSVECMIGDQPVKVRLAFDEPAEDRKAVKERIVQLTRQVASA